MVFSCWENSARILKLDAQWKSCLECLKALVYMRTYVSVCVQFMHSHVRCIQLHLGVQMEEIDIKYLLFIFLAPFKIVLKAGFFTESRACNFARLFVKGMLGFTCLCPQIWNHKSTNHYSVCTQRLRTWSSHL